MAGACAKIQKTAGQMRASANGSASESGQSGGETKRDTSDAPQGLRPVSMTYRNAGDVGDAHPTATRNPEAKSGIPAAPHEGPGTLAAHALTAPMAPLIALMALAALGSSGNPVCKPVHEQDAVARPSERLDGP